MKPKNVPMSGAGMTPGPCWLSSVGWDKARKEYAYIKVWDGKAFGRMVAVLPEPEDKDWTRTEQEATLLAAAPELRDSLVSMLAYAEAKSELNTAYRIGSQARADKALTRLERLGDVPAAARAALAAAKGDKR